ncbi:hypothetical protein JCM16303_002454 [Sporobolomyces ruberrimus]
MSSTQKLYRTLHDQLDQALYPAALKTIQRILRVTPDDELALQTQLQLLLALERYPLALQSPQATPLEKAYALYKSSRPNEAKAILQVDEIDLEEDRAAKVVLAQVDYRLGNYEESRDAFDDLAHTADVDSPELDDLQHNSETCSTHLSFMSSIPSLTSSTSTSIEDLESHPLSLILPSAPRSRPIASSSTSKATSSSTTDKKEPPKSRGKKPLKRFVADKEPVEDRWIPKRQRPSMRDQLMQNKEKARGKKKDKVTAMTQGSSNATTEDKKEDQGKSLQQKGATGGGGTPSKGGKKKKGKK